MKINIPLLKNTASSLRLDYAASIHNVQLEEQSLARVDDLIRSQSKVVANLTLKTLDSTNAWDALDLECAKEDLTASKAYRVEVVKSLNQALQKKILMEKEFYNQLSIDQREVATIS
jgi:hypothetical protein